MTVMYVPNHAYKNGKPDFNSKYCEYGVIKSVNDTNVFVYYIKNGIPQNTAQATSPKDLYLLDGTPLLDIEDLYEKLKEH